MPEAVVETSELTKRYGRFTAVDRLDLAIQKGEVYGLLGPNGSGKTTTILMLLGLTEPSGGKVQVLGFDPVRQPLSVKRHTGYLPDAVGFYDNLTARENLFYIARLNGIPRHEAYQRIDEELERVGLADVSRNRVGTFSRGMRQRLGVAELLLKRPQIIILDEPTLGLDPAAAHQFLQIIRELKAEQITVLLSSHLLEQVQAVCDRVGLFREGHKVLEGTVQELALRVLGGAFHIKLGLEEAAPGLEEAVRRVDSVVAVTQPEPGNYLIESRSDVRPEVAQVAVDQGARLSLLDVEQLSLDDIYSQYFKEVQHVPVG